jgi:hypothetical protein
LIEIGGGPEQSRGGAEEDAGAPFRASADRDGDPDRGDDGHEHREGGRVVVGRGAVGAALEGRREEREPEGRQRHSDKTLLSADAAAPLHA